MKLLCTLSFFLTIHREFHNELYILTSALFKRFFDLEIAIEIGQVHKRLIRLPITLLFWHDVL